MAYELLTGKHPRMAVPMPGPSAHLTQTPPLPNELEPGLAFGDVAAVTLAMSMDPGRRFPSMDALITGMTDAAPPPPGPTEPRPRTEAAPTRSVGLWPFAFLGLFVAAGGVGVGLTVHGARSPPSTSATAASSPPASSATPPAVVPVVVPAPVASGEAGAPPVAKRAADTVPRPDDYGVNCICQSSQYGTLCHPGSDVRIRGCSCRGTPDTLSLHPGGIDGRFIGRDLAEGMPCKGFDRAGQEQTGVYETCDAACEMGGFAGLHRTACRGLQPVSGAPRDGLLFCY